ncbi:hypothetical protein [Orenia marismortui]|uniref:Lipoprotein n=1 Tax=Orenia marismortui TaxID=46469 RepID=A0A4R8HFU0_9FIRM|nr:hypothetical protein [Orenia marismortui]TDX58970.1 hypothetical protein C7959_102108 [Orenia marismortui]
MNRRKSSKQITLLLILVIISLVFTGCIAEKKIIKEKEANEKVAKVHQEALDYLKNTYNEEFIIKDTRYIRNTKVWELTAAPKSDQELEFIVRTGGTFGNQFLANYSRLKLTYQSKEYYKPILKYIFGKKIYFYSNTGTYAKFKDNKIPTFEELLEYSSEETLVNIFIYIFEDVITDKEKKEEFLSNVMELLEYLRGQDLKWATIQVNIYDEEFFRDKDIDLILKETKFFHTGSTKLKYNALEYKSYEVYGLRIDDIEFFEIKTLKDLEGELYKTDKKFLRE